MSGRSTSLASTLARQMRALLCHDSVRRPFVCLALVWWALSFGFYGLSTWITLLFERVDLPDPFGNAFIFACAQIPGNVAALKLVDSVGRRRLLIGSLVGATASAVMFAWDTKSKHTVVAAAVFFNAFSACGWVTVDCLSCECFPTRVRTSAMGFLSAVGRVASIAAQFVNGNLIDASVATLLLVTASCTLLGAAGALALPREPAGRAIEDDVGVQ